MTTIAQIYNKIEEANAKKLAILAELKDATADNPTDEAELWRIASALQTTREQTNQLTETIEDAAKVAEKSGRRIKSLGKVKTRVENTLDLIRTLIAQNDSLRGSEKAMQENDYETAVRHVTTYFEMHKKLSATANANQLCTVAPEHIQDEYATLQKAINHEFDLAFEQEDDDKILKYTALFKPMQLAEEGLKKYLSYIDKLQTKALTAIAEAAQQSPMREVATTVMHKMLDEVAANVRDCKDDVVNHFGAEFVPSLLSTLHKGFSHFAEKIINAFDSEVTEHLGGGSSGTTGGGGGGVVGSSNLGTSVSGSGGVTVSCLHTDPKLLDLLLDQLSKLSWMCFRYFNFMRTENEKATTTQQLGLSTSTGTAQKRVLPPFITDSTMYIALQIISAHYITLQEKHLDVTFTMAKANKEGTEEDQVRQFVDDVFYMLRVALARVLYTCNVQVICAVLNVIEPLLTGKLLGRLSDSIVIPKKAMVSRQTLYWVNSLENSVMYVKKLFSEWDKNVHKQTDHLGSAEVGQIIQVVSGVQQAAHSFDMKLKESTSRMAASLMDQYNQELRNFEDMDYKMGEQEYMSYEINDPWAIYTVDQFNQLLQHYEGTLNEHNFESLVMLLVDGVTQRMAQILRRKKLTYFGSLQLNKDMRTIKQFFQDATQKSVRERFGTINAIVDLLSVERVVDVQDLWASSSGGAMWNLTPKEVKHFLSLRTEFEPSAISALKLK